MLYYTLFAVGSLLAILAIWFYRLQHTTVRQSSAEAIPTRVSLKEEAAVLDQTVLDWHNLEVAEITALAEETLSSQQYERALQYIDHLLTKRHEAKVQEYIYSLKVAACEGVGDLRGAVYHCEQLLVCAPQDNLCLAKLGELHYSLGNFRTAEEYAKKALQIESTNLEHLDLLARVYRKTMRLREAEELKRRAVELRSRRGT